MPSYSSYPDDTSYTHSSSYRWVEEKVDTHSSVKKSATEKVNVSLVLSFCSYEYSSLKSPSLYSSTSYKSSSCVLSMIILLHLSICLFWQCDVCNGSLGNLKAGDSMWIYKRMVHCENCFEITRGK
ncbi:hypothetical protein XENOCAPTIV_022408 [Xenoophorus captivus]|uniref:LIM zinc-binding domain-containing protein n=1 Tax=Xenoophorus captivus TaxID=1517983 RepID=A0ABV0QX59_9TELE